MKAILEFEAPESCYKCLMKYACGWRHKLICAATDKVIDKYVYSGCRAPECPLKIEGEHR